MNTYDLDHMLRCKIESLLEELEEDDSILEVHIIRKRFMEAINKITDDILDLEDIAYEYEHNSED